MEPELLEKLHNVELEILKVFIDVCDKLNLEYFAVYGTALGAVRHQGFIPWDDDIDVAMMRKDFTRFVKEAPALLPAGYTLQFRDTDPDYYVLHAKLKKDNSTFLEPGWENKKNSHHGIFIDIFPWDYFPTNGLKGLIFKVKKKYYQNIVNINPNVNYWKAKGLKNKAYAILKPFVKIIYRNQSDIARHFDNVLENLPPQPMVGSHGSKTVCYPKECFNGTTLLPFENIQIKVPTGIHEYLTTCYGDYMQLPPLEQRKPIHFGGIIDIERPFTDYFKNEKQ